MGKISGPCKAAAKRKFKVWPSAYASGWGVRCTKAGGPAKFGGGKKEKEKEKIMATVKKLKQVIKELKKLLGLMVDKLELYSLILKSFIKRKNEKARWRISRYFKS